jgi:hypothetical protein
VKHGLQQTFGGVPMWYSTRIARAAGGTHGWSIDAADADSFPDKESAEKFHTERLMGDPEIKVVENGVPARNS